MTVWRVFWVPPDAVRARVRRRVLPGWEDLSAREEAVGTRAGDPIFLAPDYRVDPAYLVRCEACRKEPNVNLSVCGSQSARYCANVFR
jgi:hypothetical protein